MRVVVDLGASAAGPEFPALPSASFGAQALSSWSPASIGWPAPSGDRQDVVRALKTKGAALRATEQPIDTSAAPGKCFLDMLGVFAEFETNLRRERQLEGIAKAKAAGVYKGRPTSIDPAEVLRLKNDQGLKPTEIAARLKIRRASV
jgi:DNA invertase Pin-like site-specific DNA recombinase